MDEQETFDRVVAALRNQGCKSAASDEHGREAYHYRGRNGTKCAVGHLVPDELYGEWMEQLGWARVVERSPAIAALGLPNDLVCDLQDIHDDEAVSDWEVLWQELADKYHLTYTPR